MRTTVLTDNAFGILVPILDQVLRWRADEIRRVFESNGFTLEEWEKARTDRVSVGAPDVSSGRALA